MVTVPQFDFGFAMTPQVKALGASGRKSTELLHGVLGKSCTGVGGLAGQRHWLLKAAKDNVGGLMACLPATHGQEGDTCVPVWPFS